MSKICDKWSKTINIDGFAAQRIYGEKCELLNLSAVAVASIIMNSGGQLPG